MGILSFFRKGRARLQSLVLICQHWAVQPLALSQEDAGFLARSAGEVPGLRHQPRGPGTSGAGPCRPSPRACLFIHSSS